MNTWSFIRIFGFGMVSGFVGFLLAGVFVPSTGFAAGCATLLGLFLMWSTKQRFDAERVIAGLAREILLRDVRAAEPVPPDPFADKGELDRLLADAQSYGSALEQQDIELQAQGVELLKREEELREQGRNLVALAMEVKSAYKEMKDLWEIMKRQRKPVPPKKGPEFVN